jgi:hypothetical protein
MSLLFNLDPEGSPSQDEAKQIIAPFASELCQCWHDGWNDWMTEISAVGRSKLSKRSRANDLNDFAIHAAIGRFSNRPNIILDTELGFFKLYIGATAEIVLRFKRLNRDHLAKNVRTDQQRRYYFNQPIAGIYPGSMRLTCGYLLDPIEGNIQDVRITSQYGQKLLIWSYSVMEPAQTFALTPAASAQQTSVQITPIMPATGTEGA